MSWLSTMWFIAFYIFNKAIAWGKFLFSASHYSGEVGANERNLWLLAINFKK